MEGPMHKLLKVL